MKWGGGDWVSLSPLTSLSLRVNVGHWPCFKEPTFLPNFGQKLSLSGVKGAAADTGHHLCTSLGPSESPERYF